jgi:FMN phosphatase YigB (HAD superfamily)
MIKIIYFDYHGVLDYRRERGLMEALTSAVPAADQDALMRRLEPGVYAYTSGQKRPVEFWQSIESELGTAVAKRAKNYQLHVDPIRAMWEMLNRWHDRCDLGLLTDCAADKKEVINHAYDLPTFFDHLIFSCDVERTKRDPAIYPLMEQGGKYKADECLLIDDDERNTALASQLGYPAVTYVDPVSCAAYLEHIGI